MLLTHCLTQGLRDTVQQSDRPRQTTGREVLESRSIQGLDTRTSALQKSSDMESAAACRSVQVVDGIRSMVSGSPKVGNVAPSSASFGNAGVSDRKKNGGVRMQRKSVVVEAKIRASRANLVCPASAGGGKSVIQAQNTCFSVYFLRSTPVRGLWTNEGWHGTGSDSWRGGADSRRVLFRKYPVLVVRSMHGNSQTAENVDGVEKVSVLVLGSGGREHSLCYGLQQSATCGKVYCAPGNAGIQLSGEGECLPDLDITNSLAVVEFCKKNGVGLVVVGPEGPLVAGIVDDLMGEGIPAFGPSQGAAVLEGSKRFMKNLCDKYQIPTAKYAVFTDAHKAKQYIKEQGVPIVVKADGLAAGKGVVVALTLDEALEAVDSMLTDGIFGSAGGLLVVEEFLDGEEVSFFAVVDGKNAVPLVSAQDHKRVGDGDTGPNTGGMGAYSPAPALTPELEKMVMDTIILPTVKGMAKEGTKFVGVLYAGVIIEKKNGLPKLLEYNVRFGDPECQVLMMRLQSDLVQLLLAACKGQLEGVELKWADDPALVVVMASKGYPGSYQKGTLISNLEAAEQYGSKVRLFHAGTALDSTQNIVAVGGRVLGVTAMGTDIVEAQKYAYKVADEIKWDEGFYRRDIGWRAVERCKQNA